MRNNYFNSFIFGMICLAINMGPSQNILFAGDFGTTGIIPFETPALPAPVYSNNVVLTDLSPVAQEKVVIAGTFQTALNCEIDWDPNCGYTELTFNPSTGLYSGTFIIPAGNHRFKVAVGGSWDVNYGENGEFHGADIFLCVTSGSGEITFTYDPSTNLVTTSPVANGFSPDCLPLVVLAGAFQDELGCELDWLPGCTNSALNYNPGTGLFEGAFNIPPGCYEYRVVLDSNWQNNYGQGGIYFGPNYFISIPTNPVITHFTYDPVSHIVVSSPYNELVEEVTKVSLIGNLQNELGCGYDYDFECDNPALLFNPNSGAWEGSFTLPAGCYSYMVKETSVCNVSFYGENGNEWGNEILLYVPSEGEITFSYDPQTHIISSSPYSEVPQEVTKVSLFGSFQYELGCAYDYEFECDYPALIFNPNSGAWEGSFALPAGCYLYRVKETLGCNTVSFYGENGDEWGNEIQLYLPLDGEITFSYNSQTHIISTTPDIEAPQEITTISLQGTLQDEFGCSYDYEYDCNKPALVFNPESGFWEGSFTLPAGCYIYMVKETFGCNIVTFYGENGIEWGDAYQLNVPIDSEITFSYNPQTHIISSSPYSGAPQEVTKVSFIGSLQDELGCAYDYDYECDTPALEFNSNSGAWEGSFTLPAGCYSYRVKETFGCYVNIYGENGFQWGDEIQLYIPTESEITFSYDPETHIISSTPYSGAPQEAAKVSLIGTLQDELGCFYDYEFECETPALVFNPDSNAWEGSFTLPAGCYFFYVKETSLCDIVSFYGENGILWGKEIQLFVPTEAEITFSYDQQTHIMSSTPYSGAPQEATKVSLLGTLQDELGCFYDYNYECDQSSLVFNPDTGAWEGSFTLPAGCYSYMVIETSICNIVTFYGEDGIEWGKEIQLYVPSEGEITFSYDPQTHIISSSPYSDASQLTKVSLMGTLQTELGCDFDYDDSCDNPALQLNPNTGAWEGSFTLPAGCYSYYVKETSVCSVSYYGEDGILWGNMIQLYVPTESEITFSYNPQTHIMSTTPYTAAPQKVTTVTLIGTLQDELGCAYDYEDNCANSALDFNSESGAWEGSFTLPAGCYSYRVKETFGCNFITYYGENGMEWGDEIQLYVPSDGEITFTYDPQTHIISSTPYYDMPTLVQCPANISVDNDPGICGAIVNYPEFTTSAGCGGEIAWVTQISGLPSGSLFPVGLTSNTFLLTKFTGEEITCSFDVVVIDKEAPVISGLNQSHETLWPANHKMIPVFIEYFASDNCNIAFTEISISSNEPENGHGDGNTSPDWEILDEHNVLLRAERSGKGNGREYYITIKVTDSSGNFTEQFVTVSVPHNNGKGSITEFDNNKYILYPNGADDIVNLKGPKSTSNSPYVIYDMLGVMKKHGAINNDQIEVNSLPTGIYILKFEMEEGFIFKKFIKN